MKERLQGHDKQGEDLAQEERLEGENVARLIGRFSTCAVYIVVYTVPPPESVSNRRIISS